MKPTLFRIKLTVAYDGTRYYGSQLQSEKPSVIGVLAAILTSVNDAPVQLIGASRTDAGVHAYGQVFHFDTQRDFSLSKWKMMLNRLLPDDISVRTVEAVASDFHARYQAKQKTYQYIINPGLYDPLRVHYEWHVQKPLDWDLFLKQLAAFAGTHDFSTFGRGDKEDKVRTLYSVSAEQKEGRIYVTLVGNGFLQHMVRLMIGTLVRISTGEEVNEIAQLLEAKNLELATHLAPASGLYLMKVDYDDLLGGK